LPGVRGGLGRRHALRKLPKTRVAIASPGRQAWRTQCHTLWGRARQRKSWRGFALGQRLRRCVDPGTATAGPAHGERVRRGCQEKQPGW